MYYEDVKIKAGDTVSRIASEYGYKVTDWRKIWDDAKNRSLVHLRKTPNHIQPNDTLWVKVPWHTTVRRVTTVARGASFLLQRNGDAGKRMSWVQTVYRHNQPIGPIANPFCVDACTPDDNLPFYWTNAEIAAPPQWVKDFSGDPTVSLSKTFADVAQRNAPTAAMGTTKWRAVTSIAVVNDKRVTVYDSWVWGFDRPAVGAPTSVGPRPATAVERAGHLKLLREGLGAWIIDMTLFGKHIHKNLVNPFSFGALGWTFRSPP